MDEMLSAAARALDQGNVLDALNWVALRDDAAALALRGIAMARLGEFSRARELLRRAGRAFGVEDPLERARCLLAEAEVALAQRDLTWSPRALTVALRTLQTHRDHNNALHARIVLARRLLLLGKLDSAQALLTALNLQDVPAALSATAQLACAELALRRIDPSAARAAFAQARDAAERAGIPALLMEVERASETLHLPAARVIRSGAERSILLDELAQLLTSDDLVIDAMRRRLKQGAEHVGFERRPTLFALLRALGARWPKDPTRDELIRLVFGTARANASHRARLRVEVSRLRRLVRPLAHIEATPDGFLLTPRTTQHVTLLAPPTDSDAAAMLALLSDGLPWSTSALALALGTSQRTVQRALLELQANGQVQRMGRARALRWKAAPLSDVSTTLLRWESVDASTT